MKIICIGRNYAAHVVELDHTRELPTEPQFFMKPDTALLRNNDPFYVPSFSNEVHYETELVVVTAGDPAIRVETADGRQASTKRATSNGSVSQRDCRGSGRKRSTIRRLSLRSLFRCRSWAAMYSGCTSVCR